MNLKKISDNEYQAITYDWIFGRDDYVCGVVKRKIVEDTDLKYFLFYPQSGIPLNAGDLKRLSYKIAELNKEE